MLRARASWVCLVLFAALPGPFAGGSTNRIAPNRRLTAASRRGLLDEAGPLSEGPAVAQNPSNAGRVLAEASDDWANATTTAPSGGGGDDDDDNDPGDIDSAGDGADDTPPPADDTDDTDDADSPGEALPSAGGIDGNLTEGMGEDYGNDETTTPPDGDEDGDVVDGETPEPISGVDDGSEAPTPADAGDSWEAQTEAPTVGDDGHDGSDAEAPSSTLEPTEAPFDDLAPTYDEAPYSLPVYVPPTKSPTVYMATDDDPLQHTTGDDDKVDEEEWQWNASSAEEMEHDKTVVIALSVVFGVMLLFSVLVAHQMLEHPQGCCARYVSRRFDGARGSDRRFWDGETTLTSNLLLLHHGRSTIYDS